MARLQNELLQSQKLESIGRLAGGISHDFNNLLTVIKASFDLAMPAIDDERVRVDFEEIGRAASSAARLTQQLLAFSRKQVIAPRTLDLEAVIHRTSAMLQRVLGDDIHLEVTTEPNLPAVRFDLGQAEQILVNLAVNARDAMPNGGRLIVDADSVALSRDDATRHSALKPGTYVRLRVTDNGSGMSAETLEHAFEPFYTTKPSGQGTGLGLAMIHGAVQQNHGHVELMSTVGEGTTCTIWFPCTTTGAVAALSESSRILPRGAERLLVVEDDGTVRQLIVRILEQLGYGVHAFGTGNEALAWLDDANEPIDLLMTDVIMPGMNGKVLSEHVVQRRPGTRVIFASGYTADVIAHQGVVDAGLHFLSKPFSTEELAHSIRQVLDGSPAGGVVAS
ncbi:ATP-binding protein [Gemmatimonas sp.]